MATIQDTELAIAALSIKLQRIEDRLFPDEAKEVKSTTAEEAIKELAEKARGLLDLAKESLSAAKEAAPGQEFAENYENQPLRGRHLPDEPDEEDEEV